MSHATTTDVLICGAGAAGLTLAIDLARRGVRFRLIEKLPQPFAGSRGKGIKPRTQEIFEDLGVLDRVVAAGGIYPPDRDYLPDGTYQDSLVSAPAAPTSEEPYLIPLMVPQFLTETVLRERLAESGHGVEFGTELVGFEQDGERVTARLRSAAGDERIRAGYLVGADGGKSFIRHALGIGFPGKTLGVRAMVADCIVEGVGDEAWHRWGSGDMQRQIFLCPLRGTDMFQMQGPVPPTGEVDLSAAGLTRVLADRTGRSDIVVREVRWASVFAMHARMAEKYRVGRSFLCGDSAHIHPPTGGQGLNTSIQDAYNLGWKLAAVIAGAPAELLETYEQERRPVAADMLGLATELLQALRERGEMRRGREVQQLDFGYAGSGLSVNQPDRAPCLLLAGDRAPDAPMLGRAGQRIRAFELFKGSHWTLIGFDTPASASPRPRRNLHMHRIGERGDLVDSAGAFAAAYGVAHGDWVLVRPDGYVGAILPASCRQDLERYMQTVGLGR
jgi:2-polyprenyl-6-methoxyphenol hydroxylase-like FAD-dependent oxidoreductase